MLAADGILSRLVVDGFDQLTERADAVTDQDPVVVSGRFLTTNLVVIPVGPVSARAALPSRAIGKCGAATGGAPPRTPRCRAAPRIPVDSCHHESRSHNRIDHPKMPANEPELQFSSSQQARVADLPSGLDSATDTPASPSREAAGANHPTRELFHWDRQATPRR